MPGHDYQHFTGKRGHSGSKKRKSTRKERKLKRGAHRNKYAEG